MKNSNVKLALALGCALAASSAAVAAPNDQLSVADNAPAAVKSCEGSSTIDWQKNAWTYAPKGSCEFIVTPHGPASKKPIES